jgi:hypothetical protein
MPTIAAAHALFADFASGLHLCSNHRASMTLIAPIPVDEPVVFATQVREVDGGARIAERAVRAGNELGLSATSIERLPFDLSTLDSGGVFIVRRATCG